MILTADRFGQFVGRTSERITVKEKGQVVEEVPFFQVEQVLIVGNGVSLSSDLVRDCAERGIPITFLSSSGKPVARLSSPDLVGTVITRREQILAAFDDRGRQAVQCFLDGKVRNQINTLKYFARHRKEADRQVYERIVSVNEELEKLLVDLHAIQEGTADDQRELLLSIEGRAAALYWDTIGCIFPAELDFPGRERRGATDPINSALNYGYGILYSQVWGAIVLAGLDPFAGFLHTDRPGKPSLVLDLIEEFRSFCVDRPLVSLFTKGGKVQMEGDRIAEDSRRELAKRFVDRLEEEENYEGKKNKLRTILQMQARRLSVFLRGEGGYKPFVGSW